MQGELTEQFIDEILDRLFLRCRLRAGVDEQERCARRKVSLRAPRYTRLSSGNLPASRHLNSGLPSMQASAYTRWRVTRGRALA